MSINLSDELHAATVKGKIASAKEVYLDGDKENLQQVGEKTHQLEEAVKSISVTGGASTANAVSYDNGNSGLDSVTAQDAIDKLAAKDKEHDTEIAKKANASDVESQMQTEQERVNSELDKKFDKENIAQELGDSEETVASVSLLNKLVNGGYKFAGIAVTNTFPTSTMQKVFYIAKDHGTYIRFGNIEVTGVSILYKDNNEDETWKCEQIVDSILFVDKLKLLDIPCSDGFVKFSDGNINSTTGSAWHVTEKLYLSVGTELKYSFGYSTLNAAVIAAYDKDGKYLQDKSVGNSVEPITGTYTIQEGTEYIVLTYYGYLNHSVEINGFYKSLIDRNRIVSDKNTKTLEDIFTIDVLNLPHSQNFIRYNNGALQSTTNAWSTSDKIYLSVGTKIDYLYKYSTLNAAVIAAYDKDGKYLQDKSVGNQAEAITGTYTVQEGTEFIRFCWYGNINTGNLIKIYDNYQKNVERVSSIKNALSSIQSLSDINEIKTSINNINTDIANIKKTKADSYIYRTSVRKPFEFDGKKALFTGDSITYGFTSGSTHVKGTGDYPKLFSEKVGLTYSNVGVAGATIAKVEGYGFIFNQISSIDASYNYLFIAGGVNDWQLGVSLSSFKEAVKYYCDNINKNLPNSLQVIWVTPINQGGYEDTHPEIVARVKGTLQEFRNAMTEIISANDTYSRFSIIQGNEFNFPTKDMDADYISFAFGDRLHPSEAAYKSLYLTGLQNALL